MSSPVEASNFRRVLGHYPTGVCIVTATPVDGRATGMVVGSFTSVSLDPPLVAFFPAKISASWPRIQTAGKFCVNVLASDQRPLCQDFGGRGMAKLAGLPHRISVNGSPILDDVLAWIDCTLDAVHEAGDHYVVIGRVVALEVERYGSPLLFFRGGYGAFSQFQ